MKDKNILKELAKGVVYSLSIILVFIVSFWYFTLNPHLIYRVKLSRHTFPYGLFTSIFVHNSIEHLLNNSIILLIFGPLFVYYKGGKQGIIFFILIGIGAHFLEFIVLELVCVFLEIRNPKLTVAPSVAGSSGALSGILFIVSYELFISLNQWIKENKEKEGEEREDYLALKNLILRIIPPFCPAYVLLERITADLKAFFLELAFQTPSTEPDSLTTFFTNLALLVPFGSNTGNAYFGHLWGIVVAFILLKKGEWIWEQIFRIKKSITSIL